MKAIRRRRDGYAALCAAGAILAAWFALRPMVEAALVSGAASIVLFILLVRQSRLLYDARLIWENRILVVPSAVVSASDGTEKSDEEETIVSTFGALIGSRVYKWGCDGMRGVRLRAIEIDRARVYLTFGDGAETMRVGVLHGMTDERAVLDVKQRLWHETGVSAIVSDW